MDLERKPTVGMADVQIILFVVLQEYWGLEERRPITAVAAGAATMVEAVMPMVEEQVARASVLILVRPIQTALMLVMVMHRLHIFDLKLLLSRPPLYRALCLLKLLLLYRV